MHPDQFGEEMRTAWQGQSLLTTPLVSSLLRRTAREFQWTTRAGDCSLVLFFGSYLFLFCAVAFFGEAMLCRVGGALLSIGLGYTIFRLIRGGWVGALPAQSAAIQCSVFYRNQLIRRRDLKKNFLYWAVFPIIPGAVVGTLGWILDDPKQWFIPLGLLLDALSIQVLGVDTGRRDAVRLQKEIDLLDGAQAPQPL